MKFKNFDLDKYLQEVQARFSEINSEYISLMANHIKDITEMSAEEIQIVKEMQKMSVNLEIVQDKIVNASVKTSKELNKIYEGLAREHYKDKKPFYEIAGEKQVPFKKNVEIQQYLTTLQRQTANTFVNLANTTVKGADYSNVIEKAANAVISGNKTLTGAVQEATAQAYSTRSEMQSVVRSVAERAREGIRIEYASGYARRIDSAVRMNVQAGVRAFHNEYRKLIGEQFGADGVEVDAHVMCAPDHLDIQGQRFSLEEFEIENDNLDRPISELNCTHEIDYVLLDASEPTYTDEELQGFKDWNEEEIEFGDKSMTRYEASQYMRGLETNMRYCKEEIMAAKEMGDSAYAAARESRLRDLQASYRGISNASGVVKQYDRAFVAGY